MEIGYIHSFESMGLVDGPGVRSVVFLQGCPLRCAYCHNPDSQPFRAKNAQIMTSEELVKKVLRQKNYFGDEGGVTFSGGEALMQGAFLLECLRALKKEGISTAIDTSGFGETRYYKEIFELCDTLILDVKAFDEESFRELTLGDFKTYMAFIKFIEENFHGQIWARHVMMPGVTDNEESMDKFAEFLLPLGYLIDRIEILPYHNMGVEKYKQLGLEYRLSGMEPMDSARAKELERYAVQSFYSLLQDREKALVSQPAVLNSLANAENMELPIKEVPPKMKVHKPNTRRYFAEKDSLDIYNVNDIDLRKLPLFRYLSVSDFDKMAKEVEVLDYKKGEFIFKSGDPSDKLYIVCSGQMKIFTYTIDGREQIMYIYNPGDFVGGHNVLEGHKYLYMGQALENSKICTMSKAFFNKYCISNPMILLQILGKSYDRIRWAEDLISRLSSTNASIKVANLLLRFASRYGTNTDEGTEIDLSLSREELGSYAGLTRETITRKLGELKDLGLIDYRGNKKLIIKDENRLRDYFLGG